MANPGPNTLPPNPAPPNPDLGSSATSSGWDSRATTAERATPYDRFKRLKTTYLKAAPARRSLKIFAVDPMSGRTVGNRTVIDVVNEPLGFGPTGDRIQVIDYDGSVDLYYAPVDLDEPSILMTDGLEPSESDPRFHQQMVYAVAMRVLENFERALGRRLDFRDKQKLRILPHAFRGANAFFDPESNSVLFGYFNADKEHPGKNLPGQTVFSCLSHDIIAHEVSHAIVFRLREHFSEPTNPDVLAFHEAIADIVAIFQHFTFPEVLKAEIRKSHGDLRSPGPLLDLATQFGFATGRERALRSAIGDGTKPEPDAYLKVKEPHARGNLLVEAVFDAFFTTYQARIEGIVRVATGGTGVIPSGELHPELVDLLATEASRAAQSVLSMCIRAFEYLAPVDVTFGDYLRALVTADFDLYPEDKLGQRSATIEGFRLRGIYPDAVDSLAEESLVWAGAEQELPPFDRSIIASLIANHLVPQPPGHEDEEWSIGASEKRVKQAAAKSLIAYADANRAALNLDQDPSVKVHAQGFHPTFRQGANGRVQVDIVAQILQTRRLEPSVQARLGGLPVRGGTTMVISDTGTIRYLVTKPLPVDDSLTRMTGVPRTVSRIQDYVDGHDETDDTLIWRADSYHKVRAVERGRLAALHRSLGVER